jgi:hypothetical protein
MGYVTRIGILSAAMVLGATATDGQNLITHNAPVVSSITGLQAKGLDIRLLPTPQIIAYFQDATGKEEAFAYPCPPGACTDDTSAEVLTLINGLNVANLSAGNSLLRRVSVRVCQDFPSRFPNGCSVP